MLICFILTGDLKGAVCATYDALIAYFQLSFVRLVLVKYKNYTNLVTSTVRVLLGKQPDLKVNTICRFVTALFLSITL